MVSFTDAAKGLGGRLAAGCTRCGSLQPRMSKAASIKEIRAMPGIMLFYPRIAPMNDQMMPTITESIEQLSIRLLDVDLRPSASSADLFSYSARRVVFWR
jgi:hypothetical protein